MTHMVPRYKIINNAWLSEDELNHLADEGWELVTVIEVWVSANPPMKGNRWIFKRVLTGGHHVKHKSVPYRRKRVRKADIPS